MRKNIVSPLVLFSILACQTAQAGNNPDFRYLKPQGATLPQASFGLGVVVEPGFRFAFLTGRTGADDKGDYSDEFEIQAQNALDAVEALLAEAGMEWKDVVKINVYLTDRNDLSAWRIVRDAAIGLSRPAGTGVIVKELADPRARIEIDVIAAQKAK